MTIVRLFPSFVRFRFLCFLRQLSFIFSAILLTYVLRISIFRRRPCETVADFPRFPIARRSCFLSWMSFLFFFLNLGIFLVNSFFLSISRHGIGVRSHLSCNFRFLSIIRHFLTFQLYHFSIWIFSCFRCMF